MAKILSSIKNIKIINKFAYTVLNKNNITEMRILHIAFIIRSTNLITQTFLKKWLSSFLQTQISLSILTMQENYPKYTGIRDY